MKIAVESHSGPFMTAWTCWATQLSPASMDWLLCWDSAIPAVTSEKEARLPVEASVMNWPPLLLITAPGADRHS